MMQQKVSDFEAVDRYDIPEDPMSHLSCDVAREERQYLAEVYESGRDGRDEKIVAKQILFYFWSEF